MTLSVAATTASGTYPLTISGTDASTNTSQSVPLTLLVTAPLPPLQYVRAITVDHTKIPNTDQSNFPLLVNMSDPLLASTANGGHVASAAGYNIVFTSDSGCTTKLNYEVESWNGME